MPKMFSHPLCPKTANYRHFSSLTQNTMQEFTVREVKLTTSKYNSACIS